MKKKIKKDPYIERLDEIIRLLQIHNSQTNYPIVTPNIGYTQVPPLNATWCEYCRVYNCGKMHVTC